MLAKRIARNKQPAPMVDDASHRPMPEPLCRGRDNRCPVGVRSKGRLESDLNATAQGQAIVLDQHAQGGLEFLEPPLEEAGAGDGT